MDRAAASLCGHAEGQGAGGRPRLLCFTHLFLLWRTFLQRGQCFIASASHISSAPPVGFSPATDVEYLSPAPAVFQAPTPVVEYSAPVPAVFQAPTLVVESFAPVSAVSQSPAPGEDYISPASAGLFSVPLVEFFCTRASVRIASAS